MTTEPDNHDIDSVDELTGRWFDSEPQDFRQAEYLEDTSKPLDEKQLHRATDLRLVHSLLLQLADKDEEAKERRINKLMQKIDSASPAAEKGYRIVRIFVRYGIAALLIVSFAILLMKLPDNTAAAAINQMIMAIDKAGDRTYSIRLLENRKKAPPPNEQDSKPRQTAGERAGLDGATLYLRGSDKFVLYWHTPSGKTVINGSDGKTNFHIRPDKPVLISNDLHAFRVPMPPELEKILSLDLKATLLHIRDHYKVKYVEDVTIDKTQTGLKYLDASKISRDFPGPKNIEILAEEKTGLLLRIEFADIHMEDDPSPKRLIIELENQNPLSDDWFTHEAHHPQNAKVELIQQGQNALEDNPLK